MSFMQQIKRWFIGEDGRPRSFGLPFETRKRVTRPADSTRPLSEQAMDGVSRPPYHSEKMQDPKVINRYDYSQGPMYFLGQQIVRGMQQAGMPAKILYCYRSPEFQNDLYAQGRTKPGKIVTKAKANYSAHQYFEAVDIIHPSLAWNVTSEYWDTLASVVRIVAEKYGVQLDHGHRWGDSAHIEIAHWRGFRVSLGWRKPNPEELWKRFQEVLPKESKAYERRRRAAGKPPYPDPVARYLATASLNET